MLSLINSPNEDIRYGCPLIVTLRNPSLFALERYLKLVFAFDLAAGAGVGEGTGAGATVIGVALTGDRDPRLLKEPEELLEPEELEELEELEEPLELEELEELLEPLELEELEFDD